MGYVIDRGRRIATYLRSHTGSPKWKFDFRGEGKHRGFDSPPGYSLRYMTCKDANRAVRAAREMTDNEEISAVVYQSFYTQPEDAVILMPIRHYTMLLHERLERP